MDTKKLIPGILIIIVAILFIMAVNLPNSNQTIVKENCDNCHEGFTPRADAKGIHAGANMGSDDCVECHESAEEAHIHRGLTTTDCVHCHDTSRAGVMAYSACDDCHASDPHDAVSKKDCNACHTKCDTCHEVNSTHVQGGIHQTLQCSGCHVYHTFKPQCYECHDISATHEERLIGGHSTQVCIGCHDTIHPDSYVNIRPEVVRTSIIRKW